MNAEHAHRAPASHESPPSPPRSLIHRITGDDTQLPIAIAAGISLALGFALHAPHLAFPPPFPLIGAILIWISLALGSIHGLAAAIESLRTLKLDIDILMVVGAYLSAAIGHPEDGALLLFMFTLAGGLEHRAMTRARDAVTRLKKLMPQNALVQRGGVWAPADPEDLVEGDVVLVRPGETVPADGVIISGQSDIDQSSLTGESLPISVSQGSRVFAGTMNQQGALEVEVTRRVHESSIQRILQLVLEAQERRQPLQRVIDRFSTPYTATVFAVAIASLALFRFALHLEWADAFIRAITLLVVASPCAVVIATPTATLCGLSRAARAGVLLKGGDAIERLSRVHRVVLDKTGTLTTGRIEVTHVEPIAAGDVDSLLSLAMAAESRSTHPIAAAIVRLAETERIKPAELAALSNVPGRGVEGTYQNQPLRIGTYDFCAPLISVCFQRHTQQIIDRIQSTGGKAIVIAFGGDALVLTIADTPRPGAERLAQELEEAGVRSVTMLTGDTRIIAEKLAAELGIDDVHAELMPEQKVDAVRRLQAERNDDGGLAVIGDGVNDAPALAVADVGLAMGGIGADAALEVADVVLLNDDLRRIPWVIILARRVRRIMIANLVFATAVITVLATITLLFGMPLSLGVIGHEGSTLLVVANSLRLLAHRDR